MLIEVEYSNGLRSHVMPETLDSLLEENRIIGFKRATGWIAVGFEALRASKREAFLESERRRQDSIYRVEYI